MSQERATPRDPEGLPRSILSAETAEMPAIAANETNQPHPRTGAPLLGSGPEISRNLGVVGEYRPRAGSFARPVEPMPPLEQLIALVQRWKTMLGLSLAGVITLAVVVGYRSPDINDQLLATDDDRAESRSPNASIADSVGEDRSESAAGTTIPGEAILAESTDSARVSGEPSEPVGDASPGQPSPVDAPAAAASDSERDVMPPNHDEDPSTGSAPSIASPTTTPSANPSSPAIPTVAPTEAIPSAGGASPTDGDEAANSSVPSSSGSATSATPTSATTTPPTAIPGTPTITPGVTVRVEAERGEMLGTARVRSSHKGYSGSGYVGQLIKEGSGVALTVDAAGGETPFLIRYAAGTNNGPAGPRRMSVLVNGIEVTEARMQRTKNWRTWSVVTGSLNLAAGPNTISIIWQPGDTGWVNLDYIEIN